MKTGTITCLGKLAAMFALASCGLAGGGCASLDVATTRYDAAMSAPLPAGQARVCFTRKSSLLGAVVAHYVMDCGSSVEFDSKVIERGQITFGDVVDAGRRTMTVTGEGIETKYEILDLRGMNIRTVSVTENQQDKPPNTDHMCNVQFLVLPAHVPAKDLSASPNSQQSILRRMGDKIVPLYSVSFDGSGTKPTVVGTDPVSDATDAIKPNARYAGSVRSGGSLVFDRPAGNMRFKVVTPGGDEAFSPVFRVESGRKYLVAYAYGITGIRFTLIERS